MGGEAAGSAEPGSQEATVHVRCSNGTKFSVTVSLGSSVQAFKQLLVERSEVPAEQQRLIYKGRVLKDDNSLESYGLQSDHTVHLVRGAPAASGAPPAPPSATAPAANVPEPGGLGGLVQTGLPEFQQVQQQLMQNPNLMRDMMNMPAVQSLMNNPELMRSLIMSNPQMRDIIDRNPDLAHILNDPATLRQTLDAARNPELMREMMRNTDRAMSNIEASPEGFNMLRRMYETVQEPLLNAATMGGADTNPAAAPPAAPVNPFAALLARPAGSGDQQQGATPTPNAAADGPTVFPNTAPLPNPWNPAARTTAGQGAAPGSAAAPTSAALPLNLAGLGGLGGLGGVGGLGGLGDAGGLGLEQVLQNPAFMQAMQSLLSNPQYINQLLNMHPQLRNMLNTNPQFRDMMQNPEFLRQLSSPESLQQMLTLQQTLLGQLGRQQPSQEQGTNNTTNVAGSDLNALLTMFGGLGSGFPLSPEVNVLPPEQLYATQLSQLQDMGFFDTQENIRALTATGGNVHAAVERLLGNST